MGRLWGSAEWLSMGLGVAAEAEFLWVNSRIQVSAFQKLGFQTDY